MIYVCKAALAPDYQHHLHPDMYEKIVATRLFKMVQQGKVQLNDYRLSDQLMDELGDDIPFQCIDRLEELVACDVSVVATNSPQAFLLPEHFAANSVVYDMSVPLNCTQELIENDKGIKVLLGGVVQLPKNEKLPMKGYPLGEGEAFACISETVLLGLEQRFENFSFGHLLPSQVSEINAIGQEHGFMYKKPKMEQIF